MFIRYGFILITASTLLAQTPPRHNVILFVADGLRAASVTPESAPTMAALKTKGVDFANSHAIYPTVTTANASAIATGHYLGDTGDFGNTLYFGFPIWAHGGAPVTFLENNSVLGEINQHYAGNYLSEESLVAAARGAGFATAVIGKAGPALIQDVTARRDGSETIFIDDTFGRDGGVPVTAPLLARLRAAGLPLQTPDSTVPDVEQEVYLTQVAAKVVLPQLAASGNPFLLIFWSRDPDYSQHNAREGLGQTEPGINGATAHAAVRNADDRLAALIEAVRKLNPEDTTDIFVTADHGFGTVDKTTFNGTSVAARCVNPDQPAAALPQGFLAIDIAKGLGLTLFDPDAALRPINCAAGETPSSGNGLIGADPAKPSVVVASNGGSDLIYLPQGEDKALLGEVMETLLKENYVSGIFVKDSWGEIGGALPMSRINLMGGAATPVPDIVVNFRSLIATGCSSALLCTAMAADTNLREGQGQHGGFSRAETNNFMAAMGPDFKSGFVDDAPAGNADVAQTIARILGIEMRSKGKLTGRVLTESLKGGAPVEWKRETVESKPAENGMTTVLNLQRAGSTLYFDAAGFEGRTVGLEVPDK